MSKIKVACFFGTAIPAQWHYQCKQESWAIAKMTARCALYTGALKTLQNPCVRPRLLLPKF